MNHPRYRPPSEANSLILQIDQGCPHNSCTFCGMYKNVPFVRHPLSEVRKIIETETAWNRDAGRVFLADGDVMDRPFDELAAILDILAEHLPQLARVNVYATGTGIRNKTPTQLQELRDRKLQTLYMGLESGDEDTLRAVHKSETAEQMIEAARTAQDAGLHMSIMVLLGLAGKKRSREHAVATACALNLMQPRLLACLRVVPVPGTGFDRDVTEGRIEILSEQGVVEEILMMVKDLDLEQTVFRANHASNVIPIKARFPKDKEQLLRSLIEILDSGTLDHESPGPLPMSL